MDMFDPHIHLISRVTDDYEKMALAGIRVAVEPSFWLGEARTTVGSFCDYFRHIANFERTRAAQFGIKHFCCIALNPREANDAALSKDVLEVMEDYLAADSVVAVGEVGFDDMTPNEEHAVHKQMEMAIKHKLPVMFHTPHRDKLAGVKRIIDIVKEHNFDPARTLIDHNTEETIAATRESGCWAGHTVYPVTKLSPVRAANILDEHGTERMMINSSADWGVSDALSVPRTVMELRARGWSDDDIYKVVWRNPVDFYSQSGRLTVA